MGSHASPHTVGSSFHTTKLDVGGKSRRQIRLVSSRLQHDAWPKGRLHRSPTSIVDAWALARPCLLPVVLRRSPPIQTSRIPPLVALHAVDARLFDCRGPDLHCRVLYRALGSSHPPVRARHLCMGVRCRFKGFIGHTRPLGALHAHLPADPAHCFVRG